MEAELRRHFEPITRQVAIAHHWVKEGLVKRYDTDALMKSFLPGMFQMPQCVSMMISDMTGYEFAILRNKSGGGANRATRGTGAVDEARRSP